MRGMKRVRVHRHRPPAAGRNQLAEWFVPVVPPENLPKRKSPPTAAGLVTNLVKLVGHLAELALQRAQADQSHAQQGQRSTRVRNVIVHSTAVKLKVGQTAATCSPTIIAPSTAQGIFCDEPNEVVGSTAAISYVQGYRGVVNCPKNRT